MQLCISGFIISFKISEAVQKIPLWFFYFFSTRYFSIAFSLLFSRKSFTSVFELYVWRLVKGLKIFNMYFSAAVCTILDDCPHKVLAEATPCCNSSVYKPFKPLCEDFCIDPSIFVEQRPRIFWFSL